MSTSVLFNNCLKEIDPQILQYLSVRDRVNWSGASQKFYQLFSNDSFKKLFEKNHPYLKDNAEYQVKFAEFCKEYPKNGWAIICSALEDGKCLSKTFLMKKLKEDIQELTSQKSALTAEKDEIFDESKNDPSFPIHAVKSACLSKHAEFNECSAKSAGMMKSSQGIFSKYDAKWRKHEASCPSKNYFEKKVSFLKVLAADGTCNDPHIQTLVNYLESYNKLQAEEKACSTEYSLQGTQRSFFLGEELQKIDVKLSELNARLNDPFFTEEKKLRALFSDALQAELFALLKEKREVTPFDRTRIMAALRIKATLVHVINSEYPQTNEEKPELYNTLRKIIALLPSNLAKSDQITFRRAESILNSIVILNFDSKFEGF